MDYCLPRADNFAGFNLATHATLCTHNPLGAKGCGEAGTIGAPAAIMNAVVNALAPLGVTDLNAGTDMACDCRTHPRRRREHKSIIRRAIPPLHLTTLAQGLGDRCAWFGSDSTYPRGVQA
jgi:hypothetical protein